MDKRRFRSRLRLQRALRDLIAETPACGAVSVEALARRAGVTRQTFYTHYGSIGAMLDEYLTELLAEMARRHDNALSQASVTEKPERLRALVASIFADLDADDPRLGAILRGVPGIAPEARLAAQVERFLAADDALCGIARDPAERAAEAHFYAGAFLGLVRYWVGLGPGRPDPDAIARRFADLSLNGRGHRVGQTPPSCPTA